jgi:subtilase family serine protease
MPRRRARRSCESTRPSGSNDRYDRGPAQAGPRFALDFRCYVVPGNVAFPSGTWNPPFTHAGRAVPDISAVGDPNTGMLIGQTQSFFSTGVGYGEFRIGGTSLSSPLMAGMFALAQQLNGGNALGFVNPLLYTNSAIKSSLRDVVPRTEAGVVRADYANGETDANGILYSVRTLSYVSSPENVAAPAGQSDYNASIFTRPGYDDVTGLGSPTASFYQALANATH